MNVSSTTGNEGECACKDRVKVIKKLRKPCFFAFDGMLGCRNGMRRQKQLN